MSALEAPLSQIERSLIEEFGGVSVRASKLTEVESRSRFLDELREGR